MQLRKHIIIPILCTLVLCSALWSFGQATSGAISGIIYDPQGQVIPGAAIKITNLETGAVRELQSNGTGYFRAVGLSSGKYEVSVDAKGFGTEVRKNLSITVAEEVLANFNLNVSVKKEEVTVNVDTVYVETTGSTVSGLVDEKKIRDLPLNGRDLAQLVLLQPGVVNSRGSTQSANTGRGTRFSVGGARPSQNLFQIDGTTINDALNNTPGSAQGLLLGVETVKEFRVLTNTFSAEYGRVSGGVFVAVTKSGSNDLRGSVFNFLRNDNLDARNFFDRCAGGALTCNAGGKPEFRRNQFGATIGGPIIKNKTFFFGSYEGLREFKGISTVAVVPDDNARQGILPSGTVTVDPRAVPLINLFPRANGGLIRDAAGNPTGTAQFIGVTPRNSDGDFFTVRVDHTISDTDTIFARYLFDDSEQLLPRFFPQFPNRAVNRKQVATIEERKFIGSNIVNEARVGFNRSTPSELVPAPASNLSIIQGQFLGEINVADLTTVGTDRTNPKLFFVNNYQFNDNLFINFGRHNIKTGVQFERFQFNGRSESRTRGRLRFRSTADLVRFRVRDLEGSSFTSDFVRGFRQNLFGAYGQDDFKVTPRLTLNLGLRYEFVTSPTETNGKIANLRNITDTQVTLGGDFFKTPKGGFSPRIGFAYDVFGDGKTALRGGAGIYYEQPLFNSFRQAAYGTLPFISTARLSASAVTALPVSPTAFTTGTPLTESLQFNLNSIYTIQYNLNLQRELAGMVFAIAYVGSRGVNLLGQGDINTAVPTILPDGRQFFAPGSKRRNPNFDVVRAQIQGFNSFYNSMNLSASRRFNKGLQFQTSYTFGKSIDERSGISGRSEFANGQARALDPYNRRLDRARSDFDVRHSFVGNVTYDLPFGNFTKGIAKRLVGDWQVNSIVTLSSGVPFGVLVDGDPDQDATDENSARPDLVFGSNLYPTGGKTPDLWFNPMAFAAPQLGFRGTAGRNILVGPTFKSVDLSLSRMFRIDDKRSVQFRAEAFNLLNRANFDLPSNSDNGSQVFTFVPGSGTAPASFTRTASAGKIFSTIGDSRELQFVLKLMF